GRLWSGPSRIRPSPLAPSPTTNTRNPATARMVNHPASSATQACARPNSAADVSGAANDSATSASTTTAVGTKTGARMEVRRPGGVSPGGVGSGGIMASLRGRPVAAGNSSRTQSRRRESRRATSPPKAAGVVAAGPLLQTRASRYARRSTAGTPRRARAPRLYSAARAGPGRPAVEAPGEPRTPAPAQEAGPGNGPDTR